LFCGKEQGIIQEFVSPIQEMTRFRFADQCLTKQLGNKKQGFRNRVTGFR